MEAAKNSFTRILTAVGQLEYLLKNNVSPMDTMTAQELLLMKEADSLKEKYDSALDDDFNTADAIAVIFELVRIANTSCSTDSSNPFVLATYDRLILLSDILGLKVHIEEELLETDIEKLIEDRQNARKNKDFAKSDQIRDLLLEKGIQLEDTREGVRWKRS